MKKDIQIIVNTNKKAILKSLETFRKMSAKKHMRKKVAEPADKDNDNTTLASPDAGINYY